MVTPDMDHLRGWIGRSETRTDLLTPRLAEAFEATLDRAASFVLGDEAPLGVFWCLGNPALPASELGRDGHPKRQGFMPPVPLPRRMWAAGEIAFEAPLIVGPAVERGSSIANVAFKQGRTGPLIFLTIAHRYVQEGTVRITERQTIVYREDPKPGPADATPQGTAKSTADVAGMVIQTLSPDPVLLFRYSALTFNGHRIHYDEPYARAVEGYPGLVVHGPLIATLLMRACAGAGRPLAMFSFRGLSPAFAGQPLGIAIAADGSALTATALGPSGPVMTGRALSQS